MIIAQVDLRIVANDVEQLSKELNRIHRHRSYVHRWVERFYDEKHPPQQRHNVNKTAIEAIKSRGLKVEL